MRHWRQKVLNVLQIHQIIANFIQRLNKLLNLNTLAVKMHILSCIRRLKKKEQVQRTEQKNQKTSKETFECFKLMSNGILPVPLTQVFGPRTLVEEELGTIIY